MAALTGEVSVFLKGKLQKTAREIVEKEKILRATAKNAGEVKQIDELIEELRHVGGHINTFSVATTDPKKVREFIDGLAKLQKMKIDNPFEYIKEALPYFNHKVESNIVSKIGNNNCGETTECLVHFLKKGEIKLATNSPMQTKSEIATKFGAGSFSQSTIPRMKELMKEDEVVVIRGILNVQTYRGTNQYDSIGHYFVGVKKKEELYLFDGQTAESIKFAPTEETKYFLLNRYRKEYWFEYITVK